MQTDRKCSGCNAEFILEVVAGGDKRPPQIDDVLLCAGCGKPNVVTLEGTRLMTDEEFNNLTKEEAKDMDFVYRSLIKQRRPRNGEV